MRWSSLFHPAFFDAVSSEVTRSKEKGPFGLAWSTEHKELERINLKRLWIESVVFLAGVTLSAAVIQSRHTRGTVESKYDHLWEAGTLASNGVAPELATLGLHHVVRELASDLAILDVDRLLRVRQSFMATFKALASSDPQIVTLGRATLPPQIAERFRFVEELRYACGPKLHGLVAYGSSTTSASYSDYDIIAVTDEPETLLRKLAGTSPNWYGKELNMGVYSPDEFLAMQSLSGDNLSNICLCLWGEVPIVYKSQSTLLARNFSFAYVRRRQQLGMLSRAADQIRAPVDDRKNLYDYFVKIPANVAKGTFGSIGRDLPKEIVLEWLQTNVGFDTALERERAVSQPGYALASSSLATGRVMEVMNREVNLVESAVDRRLDSGPGGHR
ncbi:hypothetical protein [Terriglobus roseus]|uniref:hypothetical protein n=1 Tax=Terriglobus roseus TaxID=392734 RepID=UPI00145CA45A|nr:hypothetical protein [Terriglobus roseus]